MSAPILHKTEATDQQVVESYAISVTDDGRYVLVFMGQPVGFVTKARNMRKILIGLLVALEQLSEQEAQRILVPGRRTDG